MTPDAREPEEGAERRAGSSGDVSHLVIGRIVATRGVKGELRVQILTDFPKRFTSLKTVLLEDHHEPYEVEQVRFHKNVVLLKLRNVDTPSDAERLRGKLIEVPIEEAVPLAKGQFYWHQIIGLGVWTTSGEYVGEVAEILQTGANDVYVVRSNSREVLIPAIGDVIKEVSPQKGKIVIEPLPGLLE